MEKNEIDFYITSPLYLLQIFIFSLHKLF